MKNSARLTANTCVIRCITIKDRSTDVSVRATRIFARLLQSLMLSWLTRELVVAAQLFERAF